MAEGGDYALHIEALTVERNGLRAERDRLREALKLIHQDLTNAPSHMLEEFVFGCRKRAEKALAERDDAN